MLELNIYQNQNESAETFGKWYARVESKDQMSVYDMAKHMAKHNTPFSAGTIEGILRDFVECVREQCLQGNTVKIENLAIFKASVTANGMVLGENYKVNAGLGTVPATKNDDGTTRTPDYTKESQSAVSTVRLAAQATGEFTRKQLNDEAKFRWTKAAREKIEAIIKPNSTSNAPVNTGGNTGGNTGNGNNVAAPTISGTTPFTETTSVTMSATSGAEIRYTTDGSTPTTQSTLYSTAISLSSTTIVKAIAIKDGVSSSVATKTFTKTSGGGGEDDGGDAN